MYMYMLLLCYFYLFQIQGRNPEVAAAQSLSDDTLSEDGELSDWLSESNMRGSIEMELPPCELSRLEEFYSLIDMALSNKNLGDVLSDGIEKENYITKLLDIFHVCEDLENTDGLKVLHKIITGLLLLNNNDLLSVSSKIFVYPTGRTFRGVFSFAFYVGGCQTRKLEPSNFVVLQHVHLRVSGHREINNPR